MRENSVITVTGAASRFLDSLIKLSEDNELDSSSTSSWVFTYPYQYDGAGNAYHVDINIKNDKSIRQLLNYLSEKKTLTVINSIEQPYLPDNINFKQPYKYVNAVEVSIIDFQKLKDISASLANEVHPSERLQYDSKTGFITINSKTTILKRNQRILLNILMKNDKSMRKQWEQDEIREKVDPVQPDKISKRWAYDTAKNLNRKLSAELHIPDLIDATLYTVKINPKYLS